MWFNVFSKSACLWKCILALCALVWPHPTVDEYVLFQVVNSAKWIVALWTFVYFLLSVDDHVLPQVSCLAKWHLTFWASVGLHCGWACAFSHLQQDQMPCCIEYKGTTLLCCASPCAFSDLLIDQMTSYNLNKCAIFSILWGSMTCHFAAAWIWNTQDNGVWSTSQSSPLRVFSCKCAKLLHFDFKHLLKSPTWTDSKSQ